MNPRPRTTAQVPHGGWVFHQGDIRLVGFTGADLLSRILAHRVSNKLDRATVAEVELDAWAQICSRDPGWCVEVEGPTFKEKINMFANTVKMLFEGGMLPVDQVEANRRAEICAGCPKNVAPVADAPCPTCGQKAARFLTGVGYKIVDGVRVLFLKGRFTPQEEKLRACQVCGCDNKLSVWIPKDAMVYPPEITSGFPDFCWKK